MDLLKLLRENSEAFKGASFETGLAAVIRHVERAEKYLLQGRRDADFDYFNDVIYRTNQAYEGILKEAYGLLSAKDGAKLRTADLEKYFTEQSVLSARVADAFQNYRRDWRNPSTHDHRLSFTEQDATLAVSTISTFVYLLVDQMIEAQSSEKQRNRTTKSRRTSAVKAKGRKRTLGKRVSDALVDHALRGLIADGVPRTRFIEIIGAIHGHLTALLPDLRIERDPLIKTEASALRPDLIVRNHEIVVVEVQAVSKRPGERILTGLAQLERYLEVLRTREGVFYLVPNESDEAMMIIKLEREISIGKVFLYIVTPASIVSNLEEVLAMPGWQPSSPKGGK